MNVLALQRPHVTNFKDFPGSGVPLLTESAYHVFLSRQAPASRRRLVLASLHEEL
jgi:hypothetical protein